MLVIDPKYILGDKKSGYFADISSLPVANLQNEIFIYDTIFRLEAGGIDKDASGEDIYGWRYRADDGTKLLIVND